MKITLVIKSLVGGGAEKVLLLLARGFQANGHKVSVITMSDQSTDAYQLDDGIKRINIVQHLQTSNSIHKNFVLLKAIRSSIVYEQPNIVITFVHLVNIRTLLATLGLRIPVIVTEHTDPYLSKLSLPWRVIRRVIYPLSQQLVCVSKGVAEGYKWSKKLSVIYNPIEYDNTPITHKDAIRGKQRLIGAMGRLHRAKGFDLLIDSFALVSPQHPEWSLVIYGEGSERESLEAKVASYGLNDKISLPGFITDANEKLSELDLFVVSSRYEGFCLVLAEAMAAGVPCISFNCPSGPSELIEDKVNGFLVDPQDTKKLSEVIKIFIDEPKFHDKFVENGLKRIEKFALPNVIQQWQHLFNKLQNSK
jgi:GalNAc-alpha-(1->4)-GalNAc-alpha-(1->3)-diNAcBac-PP-undecaprenol alpha-1,4-N-acetyl-D-galactosaminyltransferase